MDKYKEYIWNSTDGYILIGDTTIDLSNYVTKTDKATTSALGLVKPDGTTITIDNNGVISGTNQLPLSVDNNGRLCITYETS